MKKEIYKEWRPVKGIPSRLTCEKVMDDYDGFRIVLKDIEETNSKLLVITFDPVIAYRNIDESYRQRVFCENEDRSGATFIVENSQWVAWLHQESYDAYKNVDIKHYSFFTLTECVDVLAEFPPVVVW